MSSKTYQERIAALNADTSVNAERRQKLLEQAQDQEYGAGQFDINEFEQLLNRLEASKGRQQRQKSIEGRRDIFQQGLAGMMSNF